MRKVLAGIVAGTLAVAGLLTVGMNARAVGTYNISTTAASVLEGGVINQSISLNRVVDLNDSVSVPFSVTNFTATSGACASPGTGAIDYTAPSGSPLIFAAGEQTKIVPITTCTDPSPEGDETFFFNIGSASCTHTPFSTTPPDTTTCSANVTTPQVTDTITDDDTGPTGFRINDVSVTEGNAGTTTASFTITFSGAQAGCTYGVQATTGGGTATPNVDYIATNTTFPSTTFTSASPNATFAVTVFGDTLTEPDETFNVTLSNPTVTGAGCPLPTIADATGVGTIVNDDGTPPTTTPTVTPTPTPTPQTLAIGDDNAGKKGDCDLVVTRSGGTSGVVTVNYSVTDPKGQVKSASPASPLTFGNGVGSQTIHLDMKHKKSETATVTLSGAVGATITDPAGDCVSKKKKKH